MSKSKSSVTDTLGNAVEAKDTAGRQRVKTQMVQSLRLIWLDHDIDENNDDFRHIIIQLRCIVNTIDTFTDDDQCVDFLTDVENENVCMIISSELCQNIIHLIHDVSQLQNIFIFSKRKTIRQPERQTWFKIKGFFTDSPLLCAALKQIVQQCEQNAIPISTISIDGDISKKNSDQMDPSFMYTQILKEILLSITFGEDHIKQFSDYCRKQFSENDPELNKIKQFEYQYHDETPIWWYTKEGFLYTMLNRSLRLMNTDTMIKMGFFIQDLHHHIEKLHKSQLQHKHLANFFMVYRGQGMFDTEFENIRKNKGKLLAFNNFVSTSTNRNVALSLAESNLDNPLITGILFVMTIDSSRSTTPFASIKDISNFREEDEILFGMQSVFRIANIISIDGNPRFFQVELTLTTDTDQDLRQVTDYIRQDICSHGREWFALGSILFNMGKFDQSRAVYQLLLEQKTTENEKTSIYGQLGLAKAAQGEYKEAISFYQKAFEIQQRSFPPNHSDLASSYNNIGSVYYHTGEYSKALSSYEQSLEIQQQSLPSNHPDLASSYNNIGLVYCRIGEHSKALSSHKQSLEIRKQSLPPNHPDLAISYNNIGLVYSNIGEYSKALSSYKQSLEIQQQSLPPNHPDLAISYNNIGTVYSFMGEYSKALSSYEKALEIRKQSLPPNHPDLAISYNNIGLVYYHIGEYSKALSSFKQSLEIQQQSLPPNHPDLASSYNNIGSVYYHTGEYSKALSSFKQSLEIRKQSLPPNHPDLAISYKNIGLVYSKMGEYSKALSSYEKALEIQQQSLSPNHPDLAISYNNIGLVYSKMGEYSKALSSYKQSLEIRKQSLPPNHPDLASSYNNIGLVYSNIGEYSKALSSYEKALEIRKQSLPPNHHDLAASYGNIGLLYERMGSNLQARSFFAQALQIAQKTLPATHSLLRQHQNDFERIKNKLH